MGNDAHGLKPTKIPGNLGQKKATLRWLFQSTTLIGDIISLQKLRQLLEQQVPKRQLLEQQVPLERQKQLLQEQQQQEQPREQQLLLFCHKQREQRQR
jgi:hypothetical protein